MGSKPTKARETGQVTLQKKPGNALKNKEDSNSALKGKRCN